jgi:KDO2-lipid IV(A) lauroyltransferase
MEKFGFYLILPLYKIVSLLPFWFLYRFSDLLYLIIRIIGYRKKVIIDNLKHSFPNKTEKERTKILHDFYRHFCDTVIETIKLQSISRRQMMKRINFENVEYLEEANRLGRDVIAILGHYGNWEYVPAINMFITAQGCDVYRPLKNKSYDRMMLKLRSRFGNINITMKDTLREILMMKRDNTRYVLGLIADQSPARSEKMVYLPFLNQNTPIILGPEKIAQKTNDIVVFFEMSRPRRGHYNVKIVPLFDNAKNTGELEITKAYMSHLEMMIEKTPHLWLWSHKRWKFAKPRTLNSNNKNLTQTDDRQ